MNDHLTELEIIALFEEKKRKHIMYLGALLAFIFIVVFLKEIIPFPGALIFIVVTILTLVFYYGDWRCPKCENYLGSEINQKFCKNCGCKLTEQS